MSAEELLLALKQLVVAMQSEVVQARTGATDAEARVLGARNEGVVDTRLLGKQKSFDGAMDNWRQFKFTFLGYTGAVNARLKQAMIESEVLQEAAIMNSVLPVGDQQASSTQLYHMLVLLLEGSAQRLLEHAGDGEGLLSWHRLVAEYEPTKAGGETSLLLEVLAQTFKGDVRIAG